MKRVLSILVMAAMLMTTILPVMAEEVVNPIENLTRNSITKTGYSDATLIDDLMLDIPNITFTSSDPAIINPETGKVTRGDITKNVILTAKAGEETKEFSFRVPGRFDEVGGAKPIPQPAEMIYENNFNGTTFDAHTSGTAVQNSKLIFENEANTNVTGTIVPTADGSALKGKFVYDFVLTRKTASMPIYLYFFGTQGRFLEISSGGGNIVVTGDTAETINVWNDADRGWVDTHNMSGGRMKITAAFDTANNTYDLWINNLYVKSGKSQSAPDVKNLYLQTGSAATSFYIDDLKVYYPEKSKTFYEDSFDGSSLPATVTGAATKIDGAVLENGSGGFYVDLNDSATNFEGTVNVEWTIQRPANFDSSLGGEILDANGKKYFDYLWYYSNGGHQVRIVFFDASGVERDKWFSVGGASATSTKIHASIDTTTGEFTVTLPNGSYEVKNDAGESVGTRNYIHGYAMQPATGVAKLHFFDYGSKGKASLADIKVSGQATYKKVKTFCDENLGATPNVLNTITKSLNDSGTDINGEVIVDFTISRTVNYYSSSIVFNIVDASGKAWTNFTWWNGNNGYDLVTELKNADGSAKNATTALGGHEYALNFSVKINTETKAVTIFCGGNEINSGYALNPAVAGVASIYVRDNDAKGAVALERYKCYGEGTYEQTPVLYHDDFDGSALSNHVTSNGGELTLANGKLTVPGGNWTAYISLNENKTNVTGKFAVETKLTRTYTSKASDIGFGDYGYIRWWTPGENYLNVTSGEGTKQVYFKDMGGSTTELAIYAEFDSNAATFSLWLNGYEILKDVPARTASAAMSAFTIYTHNDANNKPSVDYFTYKRLDGGANRVNVYHESFDSADAVVDLTGNTAIANGKLAPVDTTAGSSALAYVKADKSEATGKFVVEFTASRTNAENTSDLKLLDKNSQSLFTYRMWGSKSNNPGSVTLSTSAPTIAISYSDVSRTDVHIKVEADTSDNSFYMWVNGMAIKDGNGSAKLYSEGAISGITSVQMYNAYGATDMSILDVLYYEYEEEEEVVEPETRPEVEAMVVEFNAYDEKVTILSPEAETLTVIAAAYAGEKLVSAAPVEVTLVEDGSVVAETGALSTEGADSVKIMLWSSLESVRPLYSVVDVKGSIATN